MIYSDKYYSNCCKDKYAKRYFDILGKYFWYCLKCKKFCGIKKKRKQKKQVI
jgi:hypothetical protein